ncbi:MAG: alanine dehydrogenase [Spirochaetes bacterium]|nr:alanine dehydrogenase [Spirochaetota bacterium]
MKIGVPREIKSQEKRVALTPAGVAELVRRGHTVLVENEAGVGSSIADSDFIASGAIISESAERVWEESDMIVKVKEPIDVEYPLMREGQILFTYLHLAADEPLTRVLLKNKVTGIAYETVQGNDGSLPLLTPMSEVAGRLSLQAGCRCLESTSRGRGILLAGVPGVKPAEVAIIGGGVSGINAAHMAVGMGARVTILDINAERLSYLEDIFHSRIVTLMSNALNVQRCLAESDLVIGAVLIPGAKAPKLISGKDLSIMKKGAALVDIAIDQGGCAETSRPTTHVDPIYIENNVVHYCVANMPGAVPITSTYALTNVTLPYAITIADMGADDALRSVPALLKGLNAYNGQLTNEQVARAHGMEYAGRKIA